MFKQTLIYFFVMPLLYCASIQTVKAFKDDDYLSLQAQMMPADFRTHFFNAPLSARVMLNDRFLGDATIVLSEDNRVQIINFTDTSDSEGTAVERQNWLNNFAQPFSLGLCERSCPDNLMAVDYNLSNAQLRLVTNTISSSVNQQLWHALPKSGSSGLLLSNQLNVAGGQNQSTAINLQGGVVSAIKNWSAIGKYSLDRRLDEQETTQFSMNEFYLMRERQTVFYQVGLFSPDSQGVLRRPYTKGGYMSTLGGVMIGSSDTLIKKDQAPALYPIWVAANQEGIAEIYRDGLLINSQPVKPGLQTLDTRILPGGIYDIEVVIKEDGHETSRNTETVNKPAGWHSPEQLLRYNIFFGQPLTLASNKYSEQKEKIAIGSSLNYLIHPKLIIGTAAQSVGQENQMGISFDWQPNEQFQFYSNPWHSNIKGYGFDSQAMWLHKKGSISFNHSRSWYKPRDIGWSGIDEKEQSSSLSSYYRLNNGDDVNTRLTHNSRDNDIGIDAGYRTRLQLQGTPVNLQLSGFDQPYMNSRNRGVSLTANFAIGSERRSVSASLGSRMDAQGGRDMYASATLNQDWDESVMRHSSMTVTGERNGVGLNTYNQFNAPLVNGSFWGQRSSFNGKLSGGLNVGSMLSLGQGKAALSRDELNHRGGGLILDIDSDDPAIDLIAYHDSGSTPLKAGRNFIPVSAWIPGTIHVDFRDKDAPALKIYPQYIDYHHISGGISSHEVRIMKIVTVMGRLVDNDGQPLVGAKVTNHAGKTVTDSDGIFALELHEKNPIVSIEHISGRQCEISMRSDEQKSDETIFAGNVTCEGRTLVDNPDKNPIPLAFFQAQNAGY